MSLKREVEMNQAISYLEEIIDAMKTGNVYLEKGTENITLQPNKDMFIEIEGTQKNEKEKLSIKLSWMKSIPTAETSEEQPAELIISSGTNNTEEDANKQKSAASKKK